jgi:hypothetical protein
MGFLRWAVAAVVLLQQVAANYPLFDESTRMRVLLVPWDTRVGSAIYRLRATDSDYDYPLEFDVQGKLFFYSFPPIFGLSFIAVDLRLKKI